VAGDRALIHFVTTVHATMRPTDLTARSGGEEFAVLFPACSVQDGVEAIDRLQREMTRRPFPYEHERLSLTFSAGVTQWRPGETLEQLMQRADASLYEAKKSGKNGCSRRRERTRMPWLSEAVLHRVMHQLRVVAMLIFSRIRAR